jgi:hypothetical protein
MLTKLLFRTLPHHYPVGSAYAHFPFLVPEYMEKEIGKDADLVKKYTWSPPPHPLPIAVIDTFDGVKQVLDLLADPHHKSIYDKCMFDLVISSNVVMLPRVSWISVS